MADAKVQVQLVADTQKFEQDMARATQSVKRATDDIKQSFATLKDVAGALGIGLGLAAMVEAFKEIARLTVDEERSINQLNAALETTGRSAGITAKALAEISENIQKGSVFDDDSIRKATTALLAFRSVQGETFKEILRLAPDVATKLGKDLPEATQLLARAVQNPGEGLKALKAAGVEVSEQQIDLAQRLKETGDAAGSAKITLDAVTRSFGGAAESDTKGLYGGTKRVARAWDDLLKTLGKKLFTENVDFWELDKLENDLRNIAKLVERISNAKIVPGVGRWAPGFQGTGATGSFDMPTDADVEAREQAIARVAQANEKVKQETDKQYNLDKARLKNRADNAAAFHNEELQRIQHGLAMEQAAYEYAYSQNEITIDEFYAHSKDVAQRSFEAQSRFLKQQQTEFGNLLFAAPLPGGKAGEISPGTMLDPKEQEQVLAKFAATKAQYAQASQLAAQKELEINLKEKRAIKELGLAYDELAITVAEAEGRIGDAAAAAYEKSTRERRKQFQAIADRGGPGAGQAAQAVSQYDMLTRRAQTLGDLSAAEQNFGRTLQTVSNLQESVDLKAEAGSLTALEAMKQKEELARRFIPMLEVEAKHYEDIAAALKEGTPERENAILQAQRLRLEIEKLGVAAEATGKMFSDIFQHAFEDNLLAVIEGTKSLKQAFKDMGRDIVHELNKIAVQNIGQQLFGKSGPASGTGGLFASAFSGGFDWSKLFGPNYGTYATGPGAPQLGGPGGNAAGTDFWRGGSTWVGERGPELVNLPRGSQVIPFDQAKRAGRTVNIVTNINVPGNTSRATADQIGVQVGIATQRALRRNS